MTISDPAPITVPPIGVVRCDVAKDDIARQRRELVSHIDIDPAYVDALTGIEAYSHLIVVFWMHEAGRPASWLTHPRGDPDIPACGVLASRGRNHPNPIGLAVVELIERVECRLTVRRLDAYDQTPVLDIKPYDDYDVVDAPRVPAWFAERQRRSRK